MRAPTTLRRTVEEEEDVCAHHWEDCDGTWTCVRCGDMMELYECRYRQYVDKDDPRLDNLRPISPSSGGGGPGGGGPEGVERPSLTEGGTAPTTLRELRKLGSRAGIKCSSLMNSETLCGLLGAPPLKARPRKPVTIILTDQETGEILKFPSISGTARYLGVDPGSVAHYVKSAGWVKAGGRTFTVGKEG